MAVDIITFSFYDGPIEGFVRSVSDFGPCYFKLIAWDNNQDQRLFAAATIAISKFEEILSVLTIGDASPGPEVWVSKWEFDEENDKCIADSIVFHAQDKLRESGLLIFGTGVTGSLVEVRAFDNLLAPLISKCLDIKNPDKIDNWLPYFYSCHQTTD